jgi:hypothetical protein
MTGWGEVQDSFCEDGTSTSARTERAAQESAGLSALFAAAARVCASAGPHCAVLCCRGGQAAGPADGQEHSQRDEAADGRAPIVRGAPRAAAASFRLV